MDSTSDPAAARVVEGHACPTCAVPAGSACRGRSGNTAAVYHTARVLLVPALRDAVEVRVPQDREPGRPWKLGPAVEPAPLYLGYAYAPPHEDLGEQLAALRAVPCVRIFAEQVAASAPRRAQLDAVLELARATSVRPVLVTVTELRRFARTAAELIELAGAVHAHGTGLRVLTGALAGTHDPRAAATTTTATTLFTILAAAGDLDREHRREKTREGQRAAAARGRGPGRPRALDDAMLALARTLRDQGTPVPGIAARLTVATGPRAGRHPSLASVYRALAADDEARRTAADRPEPTTATTTITTRRTP